MKQRLLYPVSATAMTLAAYTLAGLPWGWSAFVAFVGWPIIRALVAGDDDRAGGGRRCPDDQPPPAWMGPSFWAQICAGLAVTAMVATLDAAWRAQIPVLLIAAAAMAALMSALWLRVRAA